MKRMFIGILAAAALLSFSSVATAQVRGGKNKGKPEKKIVIDDADQVKGEIVKPVGDDMYVRGTSKHPSMIRVRASFEDKVVKSAEDRS